MLLVLHRMAASHSLFASSLKLTSNQLLHHYRCPLKRIVSISGGFSRSRIRVLPLYHKAHGLSTTSSAVATDSTDSAVLADDKGLGEAPPEKIVLPTNESSERLLRIRHTCAHVMAMAVQKLFPDAKVTIGPWIENGFYYDFDMEPLTDKDLKRIKKEMGLEFICYVICRIASLVEIYH